MRCLEDFDCCTAQIIEQLGISFYLLAVATVVKALCSLFNDRNPFFVPHFLHRQFGLLLTLLYLLLVRFWIKKPEVLVFGLLDYLVDLFALSSELAKINHDKVFLFYKSHHSRFFIF